MNRLRNAVGETPPLEVDTFDWLHRTVRPCLGDELRASPGRRPSEVAFDIVTMDHALPPHLHS